MLVRNMSALALFTVFLIGAGSLCMPADAAYPREPQRESRDLTPDFKRYDTDRNGYISRGEFAAQGGVRRAFREADANKDGRLNRDEFVKARSIDLRIKTGKYFDDAWITAKIKAQLLKDDTLSGLAIKVETQDGVVQLSGEVRTTAQASHAVAIVSTVGGIKSVNNGLLLK
jgi:hyperosmotically inducible protein